MRVALSRREQSERHRSHATHEEGGGQTRQRDGRRRGAFARACFLPHAALSMPTALTLTQLKTHTTL